MRDVRVHILEVEVDRLFGEDLCKGIVRSGILSLQEET